MFYTQAMQSTLFCFMLPHVGVGGKVAVLLVAGIALELIIGIALGRFIRAGSGEE